MMKKLLCISMLACLHAFTAYSATVEVDNRLTALEVAGETELTGAGGVILDALEIPADARLVFDPIATPICVTNGTPVFAEEAKIALSSDYAGITLGRVVLMTYPGTATLPAGLFDASSVSGAAALSQETAPDGTSTQLVLTVGDYENEAKEIRILPIGDSITQGYNKGINGYSQEAQYRTAIAARLAANGYRPVMKGIWRVYQADAAGVQQPDEWSWHCGVSGDTIMTSLPTDSSAGGGVRDNLHVYLDVAGEPDVITLLIGTNDLGYGRTAEETFVAYTNLVWEIARQRPNAKIVASPILENARDYAAKVAPFNEMLFANLANMPVSYACTNLYAVAPQSMSNGYFDGLHPTMKGFAPISKGFAAKIMEVSPLSGLPTIDSTVTDEPQTAQGAAETVPAAYRDGMTHVFTLDAANAGNVFYGSAPYTATNNVMPLSKRLKRVGYYMELVRAGTNRRRYVWVDFDATGKTLDEIDFPWTGKKFHAVVENLHVYSNDSSIHNIAADATGYRGVVEATSASYNATDGEISGLPADLMGGNKYGWNDTLTESGAGYGCFQAHRLFSQQGDDIHWNDGEVLLAWNRWGNTTATDEIGIGTYACHASGNAMDYTSTSKNLASTVAAEAYQVRHLEIWAEPDVGLSVANVTTVDALGGDTLLGAGGVKANTLNLGDGDRLVFNPVKTPVKVETTPDLAEGAKIALPADCAGMTLGRVVLLTYPGSATIPEGLFDLSSVAGPATIAEVDAPDGVNRQLVLTVGDYENEAKDITVMPVGDSITQGVPHSGRGDSPQYRTSIAARLAANGYRPKFVGMWKRSNLDAAGVQAPDDWAWQSGVGYATVMTTDKSGGLLDNMPLYLDIAGFPDVITLLIGINDINGNDKEAAPTFTNYVQLVKATAEQRPTAKIVGATVLPINPASDPVKVARVDEFNALLRAEYAKEGKGELPDNYYLLDLNPLVPFDWTNYKDGVHPDWAGDALVAEAFYGKIAEICPLASFESPGDPTVTEEPQTALGADAIDELSAYRAGMTRLYTIDAESPRNDFSIAAPYDSARQVMPPATRVSKVGYFMELVRKGTNRRRWVWVDMDATGKTIDDVDFPWNEAKRQYVATKLHVKSNYAGVHDVAPEDDSVRGIVEGTCGDFRAGKETGGSLDAEGVPENVTSSYGWNDTLNGGTGGYGCFQMHRIFSQDDLDSGAVWNGAEVLFAWNAWGAKKAAALDEIGIGTYAIGMHESGVARSTDYTQANTALGDQQSTISADAYQVRHFEIWAAPEPGDEWQTPPWLDESAATSGWTGEWSEVVEYDGDGRAYLGGNVVFAPYDASTGNVVTVETKAKFYESTEDRAPGATAQAAIRLGTNGSFQVWSNGAWLDVAADGVTPVSGEEYTLRTTFDYTAGTYSVDVNDSALELQLETPTCSFPLAAQTNCVTSIAFVGDTFFTSLYGDCRYEAIGFQPGEIGVADATVILDAAKAEWLNARGDYAAVSGRLANVTSNEFAAAWLCNLDLMNEDASAELKITGITVNADNVEIAVTLERTGAVAQTINGKLKFYGAATLATFKAGTAAPIASATLVDDDFSQGDTATATFDKNGNTFFNAKIEEK